MRFSLAALALPIAVASALDITGPSESAFWVQNTSNTITWTFSQNDPNPIDIIVVNGNNQTLNGPFAIVSSANVSAESFTITNVTLVPGDGYQVQFVNTTNLTQVFASSPTFTVKPPGSAPAPTSSASSSASASGSAASASATSPNGSSTSSASATASSGANGAVSLTSGQGVFGVIAACGIASLSALLL
ncbi:uncharacterized protein TRAVEDRAFT_150944 [Trametes versicolor FP-101664 SS1]|uniref:uncharacterized protein n=1 Tax=Trametes versicolor (strain FP-101664) TaxID=717944 RepID=UPI0004622243|nr:uncharacterized protein TRAVEDRAFT_150944 [Trametes versicolor FP-101664 SS1]EIW56411.1 hypothetical protein TRAVEDRAFT_150944 [Trametes versicolor FP-101664 SS1]